MARFAAALLLLLAATAFCQIRPDPQLTPGATRGLSKAQVCTVKWGKDERHVSEPMKAAVYRHYGIRPHGGICRAYRHKVESGKNRGKLIVEHCEVDHLISRELGGADVPANLWPQPYRPIGAHQKDRLENWLHRQVCSDHMSLKAAQQAIAGDWYAEYLTAFPK